MRAAVLGSPVAHSLSPVLHAAAYAALGLAGWTYGRHECDETALPAFVAGLGPEWAGLSLTMPLKRAALAVAHTIDPVAAAVGAVNTLVLPGRRGHNTDVTGIVTALGPVAGPAVVLGAGGTAQAALAALRAAGIVAVTVLVRDVGRTSQLRATAARLGVTPRIVAGLAVPRPATPAPIDGGPTIRTGPTHPAGQTDLAAGTRDVVAGAGVVISTVPAGAVGPTLGAAVRVGATVLDVVYAPWPTPFAGAAERAGARVVSGLEVLLHQAVAQVELMTGRPGPVEAMRAALDVAVAARA